MSAAETVEAYAAELRLPWRRGLSPAERVWMLVYPPSDERRMRARLPQLAQETRQSGRGWSEVDLTEAFGRWLAEHDYADALVADPTNLTAAVLDEFEVHVADLVRAALRAVQDEGDVAVAVVGAGALYPFARVSRLVEAIDHDVREGCRLLVLFPGRVDPGSHSFRLLDARDGFNYRARVITATKDHP